MNDITAPPGNDIEANYLQFLSEAIATGCVWGLEGAEGWALCESEVHEGREVMPLWGQPEYAQRHCVDQWQAYQPAPIALEELLDDWLPGMHEDLLLVGPNWNGELLGIEIEPLDLLDEADKAAIEQ